MSAAPATRATRFAYCDLTVTDDTLVARYELDGTAFTERVTVHGVGTLDRPDVRAIAELWYLVAGLSYYKAGAARSIDVGTTSLGGAGERLLRTAVTDGLGEFSVRNDLSLDDVAIEGGRDTSAVSAEGAGLLVPFGGGIDSVVTATHVAADQEPSLFIASPASGPFAPIEDAARVTRRPVVRATRELDPAILTRDPAHLQGHVPVTAVITLLAAVVALADDRAGVVMSNEHSASVPNMQWRGRPINHQWSKSWEAELLLADAIAERVGSAFVVASALRDRSELWVAREFALLTDYHHVFRSCNRAFAQDPARRATSWCGECDKCLFIDLVLAPFMDRAVLASALGVEPLGDPNRERQLRTLVGLGSTPKPFECVGDPTECAIALAAVASMESWRGVAAVESVSAELAPSPPLHTQFGRLGESRAPASWFQ